MDKRIYGSAENYKIKMGRIRLILFGFVTMTMAYFLWQSLCEKKPETVIFGYNQKKNLYEVKEESLKKNFETKEENDLDNDGFSEEYELKNGTLIIWQNKKKIWQTPSSWWVDSFFLADSNNDGRKEINLSVWKKGNFGSSKPFWVKENDQSIKNHFFVFSFDKEKTKAVWQSSNLDKPNCEFIFGDVDNDGKQELVVIEGEYGVKYNCQGNYLAVWRWNGWGFSNQWRSQKGKYENLEIKKTEGKNLITVEVY